MMVYDVRTNAQFLDFSIPSNKMERTLIPGQVRSQTSGFFLPIHIVFFVSLFLGRQPLVGYGLLIQEDSHNDAPQSVGLLWTSISPSQRPLPDNTKHSQQRDIHASGGIRTHNLGRRAAADLRLRPRGQWDWQHT
jgi:hypothetical protein